MQNVFSILKRCVILGLCGLVPLDKFASQMSLHLGDTSHDVMAPGVEHQLCDSAANEASLAHIAVAQKKQLELRQKNRQISTRSF